MWGIIQTHTTLRDKILPPCFFDTITEWESDLEPDVIKVFRRKDWSEPR